MPHRTDRLLLLELGLAIVLVGLGVLFYWGPATGDGLSPRWWHGVILVLLFFALVGLDARRRRTRNRSALRQVLDDVNPGN
jgi:hypothetical protein